MRDRASILVVGGGPAGASCAIRLRRHGLNVDIVEKQRFPRSKVCGCCLSGSGLAALESIGLRRWVEDHGVGLREWQGSVGSHRSALSLPSGVVISREAFDTKLLDTASAAGAAVMQECRAIITELGDDRVQVSLERDGKSHLRQYDCVVMAAGLNAAGLANFLPWIESPAGPFGVSFTATAGRNCEAGVVYMACDGDGYVGVVRLENGRVDIAAAIRSGSTPAKGGAPIDRVLQILSRSQFPDWSLDDFSTVMTTPPLRRLRVAGRGRVLAVGDAAGYSEPFTGEGMTWAMQSGMVAANEIAMRLDDLATIGEQWQRTYLSLHRSKRLICRTVTTLLRSSVARHAIGRALASWPGLASPLVRSLNAETFRSHEFPAPSGSQLLNEKSTR